jgi:hypothetical protein
MIFSAFICGSNLNAAWGEAPCVMKQSAAAGVGLVILLTSVVGLAYFGAPAAAKPAVSASVNQSSQPSDLESIAAGVDAHTIDTRVIGTEDNPPEASAPPPKLDQAAPAVASAGLSTRKMLAWLAFTSIFGMVGGASYAYPFTCSRVRCTNVFILAPR